VVDPVEVHIVEFCMRPGQAVHDATFDRAANQISALLQVRSTGVRSASFAARFAGSYWSSCESSRGVPRAQKAFETAAGEPGGSAPVLRTKRGRPRCGRGSGEDTEEPARDGLQQRDGMNLGHLAGDPGRQQQRVNATASVPDHRPAARRWSAAGRLATSTRPRLPARRA
jgi:hypothetical protein